METPKGASTIVKSLDKGKYLLMFAYENNSHNNWNNRKKQINFNLGFIPFLNSYLEERKNGQGINPLSQLYIGDGFVAAIDDWSLNQDDEETMYVPLAADVALVESKFTREVKQKERIYISVLPYADSFELDEAIIDLLSKQDCFVPKTAYAENLESTLRKIRHQGLVNYDPVHSIVTRCLQ